MTDACPEAFVALADRLADAARAEVRPHYRKRHEVEDKADTSPVTAIDRASEAAMRRLIAAEMPAHGVVGEEYGRDRPDAEFVWVLDPIDGTKRFITGFPTFGTLIALLQDGVPLLGVIEMPALEERWIGARGRPSIRRSAAGDEEVSTQARGALDGASLSASSPHMFDGEDAAAFERLRRSVKLPLYGGDCYSYGLLAEGLLDLVVEANMDPYDYLAQVAVVEGAGGVMTDWQGRPLGLESDGRTIAAGDPALHAAALACLAGA